MSPLRPALALLAVLLAAGPAQAQLTTEGARDEANRTKPYREPSLIAAQARFGELGEDWFFTAVFQLNYNQDFWGIGLQLPLRMRLKDRDPQDEEVAGVIRKQDWDHFTDYLKILRYVYVGESDKTGPYFVQGGDLLNLTVGHGTLMHRYHNNLDLSRWHTGVNAAANIEGFSVDFMMGDLLSPYLMGGRVAVRPFEIDRGYSHRWWDTLEIGASFFADWTAPFELQKDEEGRVVVDDDYIPQVQDKAAFSAFGLDVGLPIPLGKHLTFIPYTDFNKISVVQHGLGLHLGTMWKLEVGRGLKPPFEAMFRVEYRRVSGDYLGQYFNTVYEIERYQRLASRGGEGQPKLRSLCGSPTCETGADPARNGLWLELSLGLKDVVFVGAEYLAYDRGQAGRLVPPLPRGAVLRVRAGQVLLLPHQHRGSGDLFAFDDKRPPSWPRSACPSCGCSPPTSDGPAWQARPEEGGYQAVDDWNAGLGVFIRL
ncbi:MAG: hypothetical protein H6736_00315 [Alphaproteobacteria bacterium]|nr:hypothetical protein [Alphaproteobacteria bacterium]